MVTTEMNRVAAVQDGAVAVFAIERHQRVTPLNPRWKTGGGGRHADFGARLCDAFAHLQCQVTGSTRHDSGTLGHWPQTPVSFVRLVRRPQDEFQIAVSAQVWFDVAPGQCNVTTPCHRRACSRAMGPGAGTSMRDCDTFASSATSTFVQLQPVQHAEEVHVCTIRSPPPTPFPRVRLLCGRDGYYWTCIAR